MRHRNMLAFFFKSFDVKFNSFLNKLQCFL